MTSSLSDAAKAQAAAPAAAPEPARPARAGSAVSPPPPEKIPQQVAAACQRLLGAAPLAIERPGGARRRTIRVRMPGGSIMLTRRKHPSRSRLESAVLKALKAGGAPVPALLASDGTWFAQEDLGGLRLSQALADPDTAAPGPLLEAALLGLARAQEAALRSGVARHLAVIGAEPRWLMALAERPARIGAALDLPAPALDLAALARRLAPEAPGFVKWDARPGNACVTAAGQVAWFDWEHCGRRNPLDDAAWLLCDEYTPELSEEALLACALDAFPNPGGLDRSRRLEDLRLFGTLHHTVRLALVFHRKGDGPWWDAARSLSRDSIGVNRAMAQRLCARAARWAAGAAETAPLVPWFGALSARLAADPDWPRLA